ncbi:hypothetical protein N7470_001478 [Penicillium chermesinum]|nr:hypothetical protein N7470_001478 [Penicillium chermesinum]
MEPSSAVDSVVSILKERDIHAKRETIQSALDESPEGLENLEWVSKHLRPETPSLQGGTYSVYTKLENSGALQPILREPSLAATRPFLEEDIQSAIKALEASTAAIQKQSATLSQQCDSLRKQMRRQESLDQDRTRDIARLRKKHESGRQNTRSSANELSDQLELAFKYETEKFGVENKRILSGLSTYLKQDDATLASVENTLSKIKFDGNDASTVKRAAHLSTILANCTAEEIRYRLDRLYLEALQNGGQDGDQPIEDDAIIALEEELESLYPEIEILAEISTKQQFYEPILRGIHHGHSQLRADSQQKLERILDILIDMTLTKESLTAQLAERESSCEVLERLGNLYHAETTLPLVSQPSSRRESLRRRSVQPGLLLTSTRTPSLLPEQPALENLLRRIGVSPESVLRPRAEDGGAPQLHEKRSQMSGTLQHMEVAAESPLFAHLAASDNASQLLSSSLHADSQYETSLQDPGQQDELARLEAELASLQKGLQALNLDVIHQRDKAQDKFLERWQ